jgi:hypothetical protein
MMLIMGILQQHNDMVKHVIDYEVHCNSTVIGYNMMLVMGNRQQHSDTVLDVDPGDFL